jgi:hypothetical protein
MEELASSENSDGLCDACSVLRFKDKRFGGFEIDNGVLAFPDDDKEQVLDLEYDRHDFLPLLPELKKSAEAGCPFCGALRAATLTLGLEDHEEIAFRIFYIWRAKKLGHYGLSVLFVHLSSIEESLDDTYTALGFSSEFPGAPGMTIQGNAKIKRSLLFLVDAEDGKHLVSTQFLVLNPAGICRKWLQLQLAPKQEALCEENVAMLKREISGCIQQCKHPQPSGAPPTRLLDLQATDSTDGIKLLETSSSSLPKAVRYAALSYCWGPPDLAKFQLKTTFETYSAHLEGISISSMTRTLQDAVKTARALSIRYLWVDALCIIQGDMRDWMRESQRIGSVYMNAHVTICTLGTSSCVESFLDRVEPTKVNFVSSVRPDIRGTYNIRFQPYYDTRSETQGLVLGDRIELDFFSGAWGTRAWTCQEEQLSIRKIAFGASQVHFSCPSHNISESALDRKTHFKDLATYLEEYRVTQDRNRLYQHWYELVEDYAQRTLTVFEDRLPALSGMASLIAAETADDYVSGIWASDLVRGLLWGTFPLSTSLDSILDPPSDVQYVGPSWSWAKQRERTIRYAFILSETHQQGHVDHFRSECKHSTAWSSPEDRQLNPFGRIVHAGIEIEGKLAKPNKEMTPEGEREALFILKLRFGVEAVALCLLDAMPQGTPDQKLIEKFSLLLLASDKPGDQVARDEAGSPTAPGSGLKAAGDQQSGDREATTPESAAPTSFMAGQDKPHEDSRARAEDNTQDRFAYGLLLYRKEGADEYVRVGIFKCFLQDGGLSGFDNHEFQRVKIV